MRNLNFTSDSQKSIKLGDSNDALSLRVTELNQPVDLSKASSIAVKIGNTSGFLTEINVDVSSLLHPTDGRIDVVISSKISSELPAGNYLLEVWINDAQGNTVIYPDTSYPTVIGFSIEKNIMAATSAVITTITLADFETRFDDMQKDLQDKVTSGYFKGGKGDPGEKGDTGTVDNAGLISAPAFQSLQTQVNNSAVGTNLLMDTETETGAMWLTPGNNISAEKLNGCNVETQIGDWTSARYLFDDLKKRNVINTTDDFVFSAMIRVDPTLKDNPAHIQFLSAATDKYNTTIGYIKDYADGYWHQLSVVFKFLTTPTSAEAYDQSLRFELSGSNGATVYWTQRQLEKGSKATDWCPNPSEILTQSDYAKIKAAIVALGGTLL